MPARPLSTRPLSAQRTRFVQEYLIDLNARAAAVRAGYSGPIGYRLLRMPEVAQAVAEGQAACATRLDLTLERVMAELCAVAFSDIRRAVSWEMTEEADTAAPAASRRRYAYRLRNSGLLDPATGAAIAEFHRYSCGAVRLRMHDKLTALAMLGRHLGAWPSPHPGNPRRKAVEDEAAAEAVRAARTEEASALTPDQRQQCRQALQVLHELIPSSFGGKA